MKYYKYTTMEFVMDESFQQWILHHDENAMRFWEAWLQAHPEKKTEAEEAKSLLLLQKFNRHEWSGARMERIKENIKTGKKSLTIYHRKEKRNKVWLSIAAVVTLLLISAIVIITFINRPYTYETGYGEIKEIILPDGSSVTLNANSVIKFNRNWKESQSRKVWLEGEAYFKVSKVFTTVSDNQMDAGTPIKFQVHLNKLAVEVLGTQFNAKNRKESINIVLDEGKVDVQDGNGKRLMMEPGEVVEFSPQTQQLIKSKVNPEKYTSWKNNLLIFEDQTLQDMAITLEESYGIDIIFKDSSLASSKITGTLPSDNLEVILESLQTIYGISITREGNKIVLAK